MKLLFPIILIFSISLIFGCTQTGNTTIQTNNEQPDAMMPEDDTMMENNDSMMQETKTFNLTGKNFKFLMNGTESPEIRVKQGDKIRIEFTSTEGFHDWTIDKFNAKTERVQTNGTTFVEFIANEKGTFEYYCSVGSHKAQGMKGNLIVE
jgi:plastocyanin